MDNEQYYKNEDYYEDEENYLKKKRDDRFKTILIITALVLFVLTIVLAGFCLYNTTERSFELLQEETSRQENTDQSENNGNQENNEHSIDVISMIIGGLIFNGGIE